MAYSARAQRADVADQASNIARELQDAGVAARRMASDGADALRETANQYLDEGRARVRELGDTMQQHVQEQPMKSLLLAGAVGFLLGVLWLRR